MIAHNLLVEVSETTPCPHCGKPDWCYFVGELSCCNRDAEPAPGWQLTSKTDSEGHYFYAPQSDKKIFEIGEKTIWEYPDRNGNPFVRVCRLNESKAKKKYWQEHYSNGTWVKGLRGINREDIPVYRYSEVRQAIEQGETIFIVEGEKCADALWEIGLAATTNIGGSGKWRESDTADLMGADCVVICPDRDEPGVKHAKQLLAEIQAKNTKILLPYLTSTLWNEDRLPKSQGTDIADWIRDFNLKSEEIVPYIKNPSEIELFREKTSQEDKWEYSDDESEEKVSVEKHFTQKVIDNVFNGKWISVLGKLYKWNQTHYEEQEEAVIKREIANWLNTYTEPVGRGIMKFTKATPRAVNEAFSWAVNLFAVAPSAVNPSGLNCKNGILKIKWSDEIIPTATWELIPHDSNHLYTYCSEIEYNEKADETDCDNLLRCLDTAERTIFLQTIASAIDLPFIRKFKGRMVRLCLLSGTGANGKDALKTVVEEIFRVGVTGATLSDFHSYDQGRKFPLSKLANSIVNWSSENTNFLSLDSIQSIKHLVSGENLWIERKGQDEYPIPCKAVGLFNCNETPNIRATLEAFKSRWVILRFPYTFKDNPTKANELKADPRYRYDLDFIRRKVAPAFLNKILRELKTLLKNGIDYSGCAENLRVAQEQSSHLWQFCREAGLKATDNPTDKIYIADLWDKLKAWYEAEGIVETIDGKTIWHDLAGNKYDKPVKAVNQVRARFIEIFPDLQYGRETQDRDNRGKNFLAGLTFGGFDSLPPTELVEAANQCRSNVEAISKHETLIESGVEAIEAKSDKINREKNLVSAEPEHSAEHIAGMTENVRIALSEKNWELIAAIMEVDDALKKAVWESLSDTERQRIRSLRMAFEEKGATAQDSTPASEPEALPQPEPPPTPEPTPAPPTKERRIKIPRDAKFEEGQSIVSSDGEIIGRIIHVKNACSGDVRFFKKKRTERAKRSDLDLMNYSREWILAEDWFKPFTIDKIDGGYEGKFWQINKSQWHLTIKRNDLIITQYILRDPEIYKYDSPREWASLKIKHFLETM